MCSLKSRVLDPCTIINQLVTTTPGCPSRSTLAPEWRVPLRSQRHHSLCNTPSHKIVWIVCGLQVATCTLCARAIAIVVRTLPGHRPAHVSAHQTEQTPVYQANNLSRQRPCRPRALDAKPHPWDEGIIAASFSCQLRHSHDNCTNSHQHISDNTTQFMCSTHIIHDYQASIITEHPGTIKSNHCCAPHYCASRANALQLQAPSR
jgi:hypothetical protein